MRRAGILAAVLAAGAAQALAAQDGAAGSGTSAEPRLRAVARAAAEAPSSFEDAGARALWEAAAARRVELDDELVQYVAEVKQRISAGLRMPLKDRTLYRAEGATRVFWTRGGNTVVQILGAREQTPAGVSEGLVHLGLFDAAFDPMNDQLFFGLGPVEDADPGDRDDFWFEHPLEPAWLAGYRFASGDTLSVTLPDGRRMDVVELEVVPAEADVHRMVGSLWVEPGSGALVRAVYRLSETFDAFRDVPDLQEEEDEDLRHLPGFLKPMTMDVSLIVVEYAWWEGDIWLPRTLRMEGTARAGIVHAPATVEMSYAVESVVTEADLEAEEADGDAVEERHFRTRAEALAFLAERLDGDVPYHLGTTTTRSEDPRSRGERERAVRYLVPDDTAWLATSPHLPPPVWEAAPGFPDENDLGEWEEALQDLPLPQARPLPLTVRWGPQRLDLLRYNRVEELSVGARAEVRPRTPFGPVGVSATARFGSGDRVLNGRLDLTRESLARRLTLSGFHELAAVDARGRHLEIGNTVNALLFGRDDGDYYRRTGAALTWTPPAAERQGYRVRVWAERHRAVGAATDFALWHLTGDSLGFRDNLQAREGREYGGLVSLRPWWGTDPRLAQGGFDLTLRGAEGDWRYLQASLEARTALPLGRRLRLGLEAGGGTSWGDPPPQRLFLVGGPRTLRGYAPRTTGGDTYLRARTELARHFDFGAVALFGDAGWGTEGRAAPRADEILYSAGAGLSILDGLIRLDAAWGLREPRGFRLDLYLDGIL